MIVWLAASDSVNIGMSVQRNFTSWEAQLDLC